MMATCYLAATRVCLWGILRAASDYALSCLSAELHERARRHRLGLHSLTRDAEELRVEVFHRPNRLSPHGVSE